MNIRQFKKRLKRIKPELLVKEAKKARKGLKRHPFFLPVSLFLLLFIIAAPVMIAINAQTVEASDTHFVKIVVDGKKEALPTRAENVGDLLKKLNITLNEGDLVLPGVDTPIYNDSLTVEVKRARPVTILDNGQRKTVLTAYTEPKDIAINAGIMVYDEDKISLAQDEFDLKYKDLGEQLVLNRATPVVITLYGTPSIFRTQSKTVAAVLAEKKITPQATDKVEPGTETKITANMNIYVNSFGKQVANVEETIASPVETIMDANLLSGTSQIKDPGKPGKKLVTYEITMQNNKETSRKKIQEVVIEEPTKKVVVRGTLSQFASYNSEGIPGRVYCGSPKQRTWKNINVTNAAVGRALAADRGWTGDEWNALLELFACESSWSHTAGNPYSGAYGIPQALPGSKMASAGADWYTNPATQIKWGLNYISKYGSPSAALRYHYSHNYY